MFGLSHKGSKDSMSTVVRIEEIGFGADRSITVKPCLEQSEDFAHIYRAASGVWWDAGRRVLYTVPTPGSSLPHSSVEWYKAILSAVSGEYGRLLSPDQNTVWQNVPSDIRQEIESLNHP
jgi:hypothetical protein